LDAQTCAACPTSQPWLALKLEAREGKLNAKTVITEIAAAGLLIGSYPLDWLVKQTEPYHPSPCSEPVILVHGLGGNRSNLLALSGYLRLSGFDNVSYFEYPRFQPIAVSAAQLGKVVNEKARDAGAVHLVGHSLGGTIARHFAANASRGLVRSLISLGSPYSYAQWSPAEVGIFGDADPIVPAPVVSQLADSAFGRVVTLHDVGHLALIFHPEALRVIGTELRANRAAEDRAAA
jgi:pimeloyl-ACP methyl ester carboxylesterase